MCKNKMLVAVGLFLLALAPLVFPWLEFILTIAIAKGFAALGVAILLRAGLISIGHAMFYAVGAYAVAFLASKSGVSDVFVILIAATVISGVWGLACGTFLARYRGIFFAMLNLAISMVVFSLISKMYTITGGSDGMRVSVPTLLGMSFSKSEFDTLIFYISLICLLGVGYVVHRYLNSPLGFALKALHTNEVRLEYLGVSAWSVILVAYTITASLAGMGGALAAISIGHVQPEFGYWTESGNLILTAVLGGIGGVAGPFLGSAFLELVKTLAVGHAAHAWQLIIGCTLLIVIFFLPKGIYGFLERKKRGGEGEKPTKKTKLQEGIS